MSHVGQSGAALYRRDVCAAAVMDEYPAHWVEGGETTETMENGSRWEKETECHSAFDARVNYSLLICFQPIIQ